MNLGVAIKIVPDDQDIQIASDGNLDFSKAKPVVSSYDLNALEAAVQIAADGDAKVTGITVGPASIDDSKTKKNVLARGIDNLIMVASDDCAQLDARATAAVLAQVVKDAAFDVVLCGDGSADNYAQQVDVQLAAQLGWPVVNAACEISIAGGSATVKRLLEDVVETVEVPLPAVISVLPDIAQPRIPGMKDILAAGKKPMEMREVGDVPAASLQVVSCVAPEQAERACNVMEASADGAIEQFAAALKAAL